jgi:hypothetical protein
MMRLSERGPKAAVTKSTSAWGMIVWSPAGGAGGVILRKNYSDGGARDICGGQLSAWCGGATSCSMVLLWPIGEASNAKDFAPQWGFLVKGFPSLNCEAITEGNQIPKQPAGASTGRGGGGLFRVPRSGAPAKKSYFRCASSAIVTRGANAISPI